MTDVQTPRRPGRPPLPRDGAGNIVRGETPEDPAPAAPEVDPVSPEAPLTSPEPEVVPQEPEPETEPQEPVAPVVDDWLTVIVAGIEHFGAMPGPHQAEALAMCQVHRDFKGVKQGPQEAFVTACPKCGQYRCEGIPDAPFCPTPLCGYEWPHWQERTT